MSGAPGKKAPRRRRAGVRLVIPHALLKRLTTGTNRPPAAIIKPPQAPFTRSATQTPTPQFSHRPKAKRPTSPRPRLDTHPALDAWHRDCYRRLTKYLHYGRADRQQLDPDTRAELEAGAAILPANNVFARTRYARLLDDHFAAHVRQLGPDAPVFWVTLIASKFTTPRDAAGDFDPRRLMAWTRAVLGPCSFVGVVEAAFYSNVRLIRKRMQRVVSWHVHLLVWDISTAELKAARDQLNRRYQTLVPGVAAAHFAAITPAQVTAKACYMLKAPFTDYSVYPRRRERVDAETGEVTKVPTGRFSQQKREMRPGDMVRVCRIFAGRTIDQLTFAAGEGRAVLASVNRESLAAFRHWERRQPWHRR